MVGEKNSLKGINQVLRVLRESVILRLPIVEIASNKGPEMKELIPILGGGLAALKRRVLSQFQGFILFLWWLYSVFPFGQDLQGNGGGFLPGHHCCRPGSWNVDIGRRREVVLLSVFTLKDSV